MPNAFYYYEFIKSLFHRFPIDSNDEYAQRPLSTMFVPTRLTDKGAHLPDCDKFGSIHPHTNWKSCLQHAEKIGVGKIGYELIKVG